MMLAISDRATTCPLSRKCDEGIRCLQPDGDYYSCGAFGDDKDKEIDFKEEMSGKFFTPLQDDIELTTMKKGCYIQRSSTKLKYDLILDLVILL